MPSEEYLEERCGQIVFSPSSGSELSMAPGRAAQPRSCHALLLKLLNWKILYWMLYLVSYCQEKEGCFKHNLQPFQDV